MTEFIYVVNAMISFERFHLTRHRSFKKKNTHFSFYDPILTFDAHNKLHASSIRAIMVCHSFINKWPTGKREKKSLGNRLKKIFHFLLSLICSNFWVNINIRWNERTNNPRRTIKTNTNSKLRAFGYFTIIIIMNFI